MATQAWHPELDDDDRRRPRQRGHRGSGLATALWLLILLVLILAGGAGLAWYAGMVQVQFPLLERQVTAAPQSPAPAAGSSQPAPAAQQPQPTVSARETHGDWIYTCVDLDLPASKETRCGISQQLTHRETGAAVFMWRIAQDGKGGLISEWQTPTGVVVGRGIVLDAGTEQPITIPFQACTQTGCVAVANLAPDFVETLFRSQAASAVVFPIGGEGVRLILSVNGLAESLVEPMGASEPAAAAEGEGEGGE